MSATEGLGLEDVFEYLRKQANGYIAGRRCEFKLGEQELDSGESRYVMQLSSDTTTERRFVHVPPDAASMSETLDLAMVSLTHMAVLCGLIETTPKTLTHNVTVIGEDWRNTEVQVDGHTLRGVHSLELNMQAGEEHHLKLGFSRSRMHLDQEFLPRNMQLEVEGMGKVLELLREVASNREDGFKDKETGMDYGKLHSGSEEVELFREVYEALRLYEAVMDDPAEFDNDSGAVH